MRCQWHRIQGVCSVTDTSCTCACGINDTACTVHAVTMTLHARCMRCHLNRMHGACGIIDTMTPHAKYDTACTIVVVVVVVLQWHLAIEIIRDWLCTVRNIEKILLSCLHTFRQAQNYVSTIRTQSTHLDIKRGGRCHPYLSFHPSPLFCPTYH
jgi:hypothetical protein